MCRIVEFSKYYIIFIYFQAAVSALLAVSVLYVEKNKILCNISKIRKFDTYQVAFLMTGQQHKNGVHDSDRERSVVRDQKEDQIISTIFDQIGKKKLPLPPGIFDRQTIVTFPSFQRCDR